MTEQEIQEMLDSCLGFGEKEMMIKGVIRAIRRLDSEKKSDAIEFYKWVETNYKTWDTIGDRKMYVHRSLGGETSYIEDLYEQFKNSK